MRELKTLRRMTNFADSLREESPIIARLNPMRILCWLMAIVAIPAIGPACTRPGVSSTGSLPAHDTNPEAPFLVKPYLQLGDAPAGEAARSMRILWHAADVESGWTLEYQTGPDHDWKAAGLALRKVAVPGVDAHRVHVSTLTGLSPGGEFKYRLKRGDETLFSASARAPKAADQPHRFAVFGDCGAGTAESRSIAYRAHLLKPDFVIITGDIVYNRGRITEYRDRFWPVYNADEPSPAAGAPLLRSTLFVAAPGNHDIQSRDLEKYPDILAYFLYWNQPLNGLPLVESGPHVPALTGPEANRKAFLEAAAGAFPRMANFSFDYGNAHWTVVDGNGYVDWTEPALRAWVESDLEAAKGATWRFVAYHHPAFNSAKSHFDYQKMRRLTPVLEAGKVDVVFNGHVHNYQRSYPLRFKPAPGIPGVVVPPGKEDNVPGEWTLDRDFDGITRTRPQGIIHVVTGAGGAALYNPEQQNDPASWQPFTQKFISTVHSLTLAEVEGTTLTIRQVSVNGEELDRFVITK